MSSSIPGVSDQILQWFHAVDQDRSGRITARELQRALVNGNMSEFSLETCSLMVQMFDTDLSGSIDVEEFGRLFEYIWQWKVVFERFDRDRSGTIEERELGLALDQLGYRFSPVFVRNCVSSVEPRTRRIHLDRFIHVSVQLHKLTDSFRSRDREGRGQTVLGYEDFLGLALGVHQ